MNAIKSTALLVAAVCLMGLAACSSDDDVTSPKELKQMVAEARGFLTGDIVLNIRAFREGDDKTLLTTGCPIIYGFTWDADGDTLNIDMKDFTMEGMPYTIKSFACDVKFTSISLFDKDEYPDAGWVKFEGKDGYLRMESYVPQMPSVDKQIDGSSMAGFYNVRTHAINFRVDFNQMLGTATAIEQTVDKSRLAHFDEDKAQYEEDYEKAKAEQQGKS
jgi:hypothetical protein